MRTRVGDDTTGQRARIIEGIGRLHQVVLDWHWPDATWEAATDEERERMNRSYLAAVQNVQEGISIARVQVDRAEYDAAGRTLVLAARRWDRFLRSSRRTVEDVNRAVARRDRSVVDRATEAYGQVEQRAEEALDAATSWAGSGLMWAGLFAIGWAMLGRR